MPGLAEHQRQLQEHRALVQQSQPQQLPQQQQQQQQQQQTQFNVQQPQQQPTHQQVLATHQQGKSNLIFLYDLIRNEMKIFLSCHYL